MVLQPCLRTATSSRAYAALADAYRSAGRLTEAVDLLERGNAAHPDYVSALVLQGLCLLELGRHKEAEATFTSVMARDGENLVALTYRGKRAAERGEITEAILLFDRILKIDPWNRDVRAAREKLGSRPPGPTVRGGSSALRLRKEAIGVGGLSASRLTVKKAALLAMVIIPCGYYATHSPFSSAPDIPLVTVRRGEFILSERINGHIEARNAVLLTAPRLRNLQITWVAPQGSLVEPGDPVIRFDASQQTASVQEHLSALKIAETSQQRVKTELLIQRKLLELEIERARRNYDEQKHGAPRLAAEARLQFQLAELNYDAKLQQVRADVAKAELEIQRARDKVTMAQRELDQMTITAPIAGMVVYLDSRKGGSGAKVQAGDAPWPNQPLVALPDLSEMIVKAMVYEVDASAIEPGQEATVEVDALPGTTYPAKVSWKSTLARLKEPGSKLSVFDVELAVLTRDPALRPGMSASAHIIVDRIAHAVSVPLEAIFEKDGEPTVYLANKARRTVQVGRRNDREVEVVSGLQGIERLRLLDPTLESSGLPREGATSHEFHFGSLTLSPTGSSQ